MSGRTFVIALIVLGIVLAIGAWWLRPSASPVTVDEIGDQVQTLPRDQLPVFATGGDTATLYRFAVDHPDSLKNIECTCGCVRLGHVSNRFCYVKAEPGNDVTFTSHAAT